MSASRMKNLILLILTLCALGLLCIVVPNRLAQTHEQRQMLQELKTLYESYGLSVLLDELPRSPVLYSVELSEDGAQTAAQALLGVPVLGSQLALSYTDDCLTAVEGTFYTGGSSITRVSEQESISAADALAQLLARRDALGWVGSAVTGLTQAYLPSDQAGTGIRFVPVWLVETDAGSFFINGITREITAET